MRLFRIFHETEYRYRNPVKLEHHKILVRPRDGHDVRIESSRLEIEPAASIAWLRDEFDNSVALAHFGNIETSRLSIISEVTVAQYSFERESFSLEVSAQKMPVQYTTKEQERLASYFGPRVEPLPQG